ncbi:MAG: hypothetical protein IPL49_03005 [Saprospirales bacterium]|nr:hypothetical protein [Saprospirales bacterium]
MQLPTANCQLPTANCQLNMGYQSRKRNYVSRRERFLRTLRVIRVLLIFAFLFAGVYAMMNWNTLFFYLKTYFYY